MPSSPPSSARAPWLRPVRAHQQLLWWVWTLTVLVGVAAAFFGPALARTAGRWPAPLDDTYIYFGFARSWALGHPMAWQPDGGYSSGCTSPLYPLLLAPAYALGFSGTRLGAFAAVLALVCLIDLCRSMRQVLDGRPASFAAPLLVVAIPLLDWSWWSGMETALLGALLGRALWAASRARRAAPSRR
ncbi:MAG: hypothetical protein JRI23_22470, partial [Deltaproteobacteria bacterium]|nr:hypothetical protein [Deltaproteobacteria bacterium]MBW2534719.1 hypothetical protein [Deltaproteobacteria bacterium]